MRHSQQYTVSWIALATTSIDEKLSALRVKSAMPRFWCNEYRSNCFATTLCVKFSDRKMLLTNDYLMIVKREEGWGNWRETFVAKGEESKSWRFCSQWRVKTVLLIRDNGIHTKHSPNEEKSTRKIKMKERREINSSKVNDEDTFDYIEQNYTLRWVCTKRVEERFHKCNKQLWKRFVWS